VTRSYDQPQGRIFYRLHAGLLFGVFYDLEDGGDIFIRNLGWISAEYTALYPRRYNLASDVLNNLTNYKNLNT
jgi:hypothetical protein